MIAAQPPPARSFYLVMTVASLLVGGAIGAQLAPHRMPAAPPTIVHTPAPSPEVRFAQPPPALVPECELYLTRMSALSRCEKLPKDARDAIAQSLDQIRDAWRHVPESALADTVAACHQANDALAQASGSIGCPL